MKSKKNYKNSNTTKIVEGKEGAKLDLLTKQMMKNKKLINGIIFNPLFSFVKKRWTDKYKI